MLGVINARLVDFAALYSFCQCVRWI